MLEQLTWKEAKEQIEKAKVALIPVGSTEQHGTHLPLGTDYLVAKAIADKVADEDEFISTPPVTVGVAHHHRQFFGTLWVSSRKLCDYVTDIALSLKYHGLDRIIFVNGHGGNQGALAECCTEILRDKEIFALVYQYLTANQEEINKLFGGPIGGHADEMETSLMMKIAPELVREQEIKEAEENGAEKWGIEHHGVRTSFDAIEFTSSGAVGKPTRASKKKGEEIFRIVCEQLSNLGKWLANTEDLDERPHKR